jgi:hypothetical protein
LRAFRTILIIIVWIDVPSASGDATGHIRARARRLGGGP